MIVCGNVLLSPRAIAEKARTRSTTYTHSGVLTFVSRATPSKLEHNKRSGARIYFETQGKLGFCKLWFGCVPLDGAEKQFRNCSVLRLLWRP